MQEGEIGSLRRDNDSLGKRIDTLEKVVLLGNGKDPLTQRMSAMEGRMTTMEQKAKMEAEATEKRQAEIRWFLFSILLVIAGDMIAHLRVSWFH
ncbi:MAG: hypothetical protein KGL39_30470 [Patescibacteria group bacterium]|nr:hypothetical protein [Patescibacteria group bacterium]